MKISVILCTYNRCESLTRALESVAASQMPDSVDWEILVVDNNSKDRTRAVTSEFCLRHPGRVRYLFEAQQGLSNARNAGIHEARSEIIAFTDDDVTVEPTWLHNLTASLHDGLWAGAGGEYAPHRILPSRIGLRWTAESWTAAACWPSLMRARARAISKGPLSVPTWLFAKMCSKNTEAFVPTLAAAGTI